MSRSQFHGILSLGLIVAAVVVASIGIFHLYPHGAWHMLQLLSCPRLPSCMPGAPNAPAARTADMFSPGR